MRRGVALATVTAVLLSLTLGAFTVAPAQPPVTLAFATLGAGSAWYLVRGHAGFAEFDPKTAWKPEEVGIPLHPGAERVYREKGWLR